MARLEIEITALDRASGQLKGVAKSLDGLDVRTKNLSSAFRKFEGTLVSVSKRIAKVGAVLGATLSGALSGLGYAMVRTNAQFEKFQLTLETLYRSQSKAKQAMDAIMEFAAKTPFELEQVTSAFVRLKTYGFEPFQNDTLRILGDVAAAFAGMGKTIDDVVEALADATVGEFERLKEFGIKASVEGQKVVLRYVDAHGQVVQKVVEKNEEVIRSTLLAIWNERYGGQMQKLSGSWDQIMSNIKDNWTRFMKAVGESGAFQALKERLADILKAIDKAFDSREAQRWAQVVGKAIVLLVDGATALAKIGGEFEGLFLDSLRNLKRLWEGITEVINQYDSFWGGVWDTIKGISGVFGYIVNALAKVLISGLADIATWLLRIAKRIEQGVIAPVTAGMEWIWQKFLEASTDAINKAGEKIVAFVDKVLNWFKFDLIAPLKASWNVFWDNFKVYALKAIKVVADKLKELAESIADADWLPDSLQEKAHNLARELNIEITAPISYEEAYRRAVADMTVSRTTYTPILPEYRAQSYERLLAEHREGFGTVNDSLIASLEKFKMDAERMFAEGMAYYEQVIENSKMGTVIFKVGKMHFEDLKTRISNILSIAEEFGNQTEKTLKDITNIVRKPAKAFKETEREVEKQAKKTQEKAKSIWDKLREFFSSFWKNFKKSRLGSILDSMWQGIKTAWGSGAKEGETGLVAQVKNTFSNILSGASVGGLFGAMGSFLADQLLQNEKIRETLQKIFGAIQKLLTPVAEVIAPVIEVIADILMEFKPVFKLIAGLLKPIASAVREMLKLFTKLDSFFKAVVKPVFDVLVNVLKGLWNAIKALVDAIKSLGKPLKKAKDALADLWDNTIGSILHQGGLVKPVVAHRGMFLGNLRQDEVPVIAQQGEYIVNREATFQYLPILQAINEGKFIPQANITVNVYAQSFDRDFVENELIPLLDDLKRRGKWS